MVGNPWFDSKVFQIAPIRRLEVMLEAFVVQPAGRMIPIMQTVQRSVWVVIEFKDWLRGRSFRTQI